ncbi:hypothetical protein D0T60_10525 [Bacteroides sp. 224]|nr:hypothetical protein [Bacteroides sp. 224]
MAVNLVGCSDNNSGDTPYTYPPRVGTSYIQQIIPMESLDSYLYYNFEVDEAEKYIYYTKVKKTQADCMYAVSDGIAFVVHPVPLVQGHGISATLEDTPEGRYFRDFVAGLGDNACEIPFYPLSVLCDASVTDPSVSSMTITCDKSFSALMLAGTNLNSLFRCYFENPYLVIANSYKQPVGDNIYKVDTAPHYSLAFPSAVVGSRLDEIDFSQIVTIGATWILELTSAPETTDTYTFTISVKKENGETLSTQLAPIQIKGSNDI